MSVSARVATFGFRGSVDADLPWELLEALSSIGKTEGALKEDFGWCVPFELGGKRYHVFLGPRIDDASPESDWVLWVEVRRSMWSGLFAHSGESVEVSLLKRIQRALESVGGVSDVLWHDRESFDRGDESRATPL